MKAISFAPLGLVISLATALTSCYSPTFPEGLACSESNDCPPGQACDVASGLCWSTDAAACGGDPLQRRPRHVDRCAIPLVSADVVLPVARIVVDTSAATITVDGVAVPDVAITLVTQTDGGTQAVVLAAHDLTLPAGAELVVAGAWPLIIVATGTLTIDGTLDASAAGTAGGPGADRACVLGRGAAGEMQMASIDWGGTGGGGSAYGSPGGAAAEITPAPVDPQAIAGGAVWGDPFGGSLLGGCTGGAGGVGFAGDQVAGGGGGGGGVELIGGVAIAISGVVSVSGGGGAGGIEESAGGGGGGSGGALVLQTPSLIVTGGRLTANGGGGGEGRFEIQAAGAGGQDGALDSTGGAGGGGGGSGGDGGAGSVNGDPGSAGSVGAGTGDMPAGGGGGGGGAGRIVVDAPDQQLTDELFSPPPTII